MKTITPTMNQSIRRTAVAVLCLLISCAAFADGSEKFFATSAHDRITAQFLVTLAGSEDADFDAIAGAVSRAYGVRIEPFAASGFHGFLTVTTPARARAISADARVVRVDEQRDTDSAGLPRVDSAPPPALQTPPAAAATLQPRSEWTQSPVLWSSGSYGYDGVGNIKSIGDDQYRYDRVGRLVSATAKTVGNTSNAQTFTHDEYGNRRSATTLTASGTYVEEYPVQPLTNQHTGPCPRLTPDATCYIGQYDAAGNQTGITGGGNFTYDALGMMTTLRVDQPQGYIYDANDERIATIQYIGTSEKARRYTLRGSDNKVARELLFRAPTQQWEFGTDYLYREGALLASYSAPDAALPDRHYHLDHLGSPRVITDASGYRLSTMTYLPFGREAAGSDKSATRLQFTGHERDQDGSAATFGLDYMHARYYSADMGRFLSVDPVINSGAMTSPQMWNRYSYTANNPINRTDPDGRNWFNIDGTWEWHKGKNYTDADGHKYTSNYTHLLVAQAVGTTKTGATQFKLTLYNQNKVAATGSYFSGGGGHMRIPMGNYTIRGDIKDPVGPNAINPNSPLKNPPVFYGMQVIRNEPLLDSSTGKYYDVFGAYGGMRAYLNPWNPSIPGSTGNYLHGQAATGPSAHGYTHGCLCYGQDTTIINYLWKLGERVPVSVDGSVDKP